MIDFKGDADRFMMVSSFDSQPLQEFTDAEDDRVIQPLQ
jgi:hypothetical protein